MSITMGEKLFARRSVILNDAYHRFVDAEEALYALNLLDDIVNVIPFTLAEVQARFDALDEAFMAPSEDI